RHARVSGEGRRSEHADDAVGDPGGHLQASAGRQNRRDPVPSGGWAGDLSRAPRIVSSSRGRRVAVLREACMTWKAVGILTVLLGFVPMTAPLSAHHSRAMFDVSELVSVEGVVTKVEWRNPHMWVTLDVPSANGKTESWGFEG